jgi:methionyl-tRNA synthetase
VEFIAKNEGFIFPRYRQKQVAEFLKEYLNDLCISRPRERLEWGIPLPFDEAYVTYVWFDALVNYYSAVADKPGVWPPAWHVIGKDILVPPHAVYWPIMLHAAGIELPRGLLVHGWWLTKGAKMSKSSGNAFNPMELVTEFGADALRFFLMREMNVGQDGDFSRELFLTRYNSELANDLGNLVNRVLNMTGRFAGGVIPQAGADGEPEAELRNLWAATSKEYIALFGQFQFHTGLERLFTFVRAINAYVEKRAPWKLGKSADPADKALLDTSLATMAEALRLGSVALRPVMPVATERINGVLGYKPSGTWAEELAWDGRLAGSRVEAALVLFPRPLPAAAKAP